MDAEGGERVVAAVTGNLSTRRCAAPIRSKGSWLGWSRIARGLARGLGAGPSAAPGACYVRRMRKGRAVRIREFGGPEVLEFVDVEPRPPGHGEILVRVEAAGLNRADLLQRRGLYPAPPDAPADVPGLEYAGVVEAAGPGAGWEAGDRVMGIVGGGAMATHVTVSGREAMPIPEGMPAADAAAIPEVFLTAYDALFVQGELRLGETVLV